MLNFVPSDTARLGPRLDILLEHLIVGAGIIVLAVGLQHALALSALFTWKVIAALLGGGALTLTLVVRHLPTSTLGAANLVTLARGGLIVVLLGFLGEGDSGWFAFLIAAVALTLDGVDGWLARRLRLTSDFGARFDMETDAVSVLAISVLAWHQGKAGPWIVLAGVLRYVFVAATIAVPRLAGPLRPSWRRKAAFVLAAMTLLACLAPIVTAPLSIALAATGLSVLAASFAVDVVQLAHAGGARRA